MSRRGWTIAAPPTDPYRTTAKYPEPAICSDCGVAYSKGHFSWQKHPPAGVHTIVCPACQRLSEAAPGGVLILRGDFVDGHPDELLGLIANIAEAETAEHPLERIIAVLTLDDRIEVTTTYEHLARRIGEAIHRAYKGELRMHYAEDEHLLRMQWHRN